MASSRRRTAAEGDEEGGRRPRQRSQSSTSVMLPAAILLGMIVGAIVLARAIADKEDAQAAAATEQPAEQKYVTTVPDEEPPKTSGIGSPGSFTRAPSGLAASNPQWAEALTIAAAADELFAEAQKAKADGDHAAFQLKGKAAKETYDKAATLTAAWEEELLETYGERDPQVRDIQRTRTRWLDRLRVLHKTTGR